MLTYFVTKKIVVYYKKLIMKIVVFFSCLILCLIACDNSKNGNNQNSNNIVDEVDNLLLKNASPKQYFIVSASKSSIIKGKEGTIVYVEPQNLMMPNNQSLGKEIEVELLELNKKSDLLAYNTPTITSKGDLLVSGGVYYINMTSNGEQLKIKNELKVEFPKLTKEKMELFMGTKNASNQVVWTSSKQKFLSKELDKPRKPKKKKTTSSEIDVIMDYVEGKTEKLTEEELSEYKKKKQAYEEQMKTYNAITLLAFGWINCDRFLNDPNPKVDIELLVANNKFTKARFYLMFKGIRSLLSLNYTKGEKSIFNAIPTQKDVELIGVAYENGDSYIFRQALKTKESEKFTVDFAQISIEKLEGLIKELN